MIDIKTAQFTLQTAVTRLTDERASYQLALDTLNATFKPDLNALIAAQTDADTERAKTVTAVNEKVEAVATLVADISTKDATIADLTKQIEGTQVPVSVDTAPTM